ncbi:cytidylyltransferase domain-containing protein [Salinibacter ruber]|uniref:cytidylyltransferase domain-containing protein n=1 Tax=Salinibacter ruber TaxID=146919 RepID=UPI002072B670|nr:glycosyltransferase family protein [Salinibacter ruber]
MRIVAIIQARMGSTRLPGKVMREIRGRPMIDWVVGRADRISKLDETVVATSVLEQEKPLVEHLGAQNVPVVRGPEEDVLARFVQAAETKDADAVVRITADCPLLMPEVSGQVIRSFVRQECDYASNTIERTYPRGLDTEVISTEALQKTDRKATSSADREHVTRYVRRRPEQFRQCSVAAEIDRSDLRWTVDEEADLKLVRRIYEALGAQAMEADYEDVLGVLEERPEWTDINRQVEQKKC